MRIAFDVNVKAVLAVVAVGVVSVGSFYAGERHQARKDHAPIVFDESTVRSIPAPPPGYSASDVVTKIPVGKDVFDQVVNVMDFCKAHPNRAFISGANSGTCTSDGDAPDMKGWK